MPWNIIMQVQILATGTISNEIALIAYWIDSFPIPDTLAEFMDKVDAVEDRLIERSETHG